MWNFIKKRVGLRASPGEILTTIREVENDQNADANPALELLRNYCSSLEANYRQKGMNKEVMIFREAAQEVEQMQQEFDMAWATYQDELQKRRCKRQGLQAQDHEWDAAQMTDSGKVEQMAGADD